MKLLTVVQIQKLEVEDQVQQTCRFPEGTVQVLHRKDWSKLKHHGSFAYEILSHALHAHNEINITMYWGL